MPIIRIIQGDVLKGLASLPDESVHCVVTSPPYWGLRDYQVEGQIGLEPTPEEYVEKMVEVFREVRRVLRKDGTVWLNMGDCYAGSGKGPTGENGIQQAEKRMGFDKSDTNRGNRKYNPLGGIVPTGLKPKDLVGMPWRVAFALQADGWWLRCDIIWSKPNPMPESVTDRPTTSHEHVFLLAKSAHYFYDGDAIRERSEDFVAREDAQNNCSAIRKEQIGRDSTAIYPIRYCNPAGRNRHTVWEIPTRPFPEAHFATFPEKLVEPCIKAGTGERGCCPKCGAPWRRVVDVNYERPKTGGPQNPERYGDGEYVNNSIRQRLVKIPTTTGWSPGCTCGGEAVSCVVLDPFAGSGTVAQVARDLGRDSIMIELSPAYVEIMKRRLRFFEQLTPEILVEPNIDK